MKIIVTAFAFFILFSSFSGGANAESGTCIAAHEKLEEFLQAQPKTCTADEDCEGHFYRADGCKPAIVLPRGHDTPEFLQALEALQSEVRSGCASDWATRGPCALTPFQAKCVKNLCAGG
ncbi:MAG: hypothetical protein K0R10_107 [Alphaproteobacteria bacterium]|nr:hypothetical protein [Alphaproteobacteria bacterium]